MRAAPTAEAPGGGVIPILDGDGAEAWLEDRDRSRQAPDRERRDRVEGILREVRARGDEALRELSERLDGRCPRALRVPRERCRAALEALPSRRRRALERAVANVTRFHAAQRREEEPVEVEPGVRAWREFRPVERVGAYVPGGRGAYPSSLVMVAAPARAAGCGEILACSPPADDGWPAAGVMAAAALLEVDALYAVGGAQAVAALAWGTDTVRRADKIFGPGGAWVTAAKHAVSEVVAVDLPAGPSEVVAWADEGARPDWVAAELLAQAEHGPDSLCVGVVPDRASAEAVAAALRDDLRGAGRKELAEASLARSALLVADDDATALRWINLLAPEHLAILRRDARERAAEIRHAGSVFVGETSPVAAGDYAAGTNHVLPTAGRARGTSGLSLDDFGRWIQFQEITPEGLGSLGPAVEELARWEGFDAHAASIRRRLEAS
jgi:histidinol dehydrogenase